MVFLKEFFEKLDFEKYQQTTIWKKKITQHAMCYACDKDIISSVV